MASIVTPELEAALGQPIKGPSALGSDPRRLFRLIWTLAVTDFKLKFFGSVLGYLWQIMQPLMLFGVLYVVFSLVLNFTGTEEYYPVAILLGIVMFGSISEMTQGSIRSVGAREPLVRKIEFPRFAIPAAQVLQSMFNFGLNIIPVFVFLILAGGSPRWTWLELPVIAALFAALGLGLAMLLSALWVRYRDVEPIWTVVLQGSFYISPIIFTISLVQEKGGTRAGELMMLNPFAALLQQARHAIIDPSHQSAAAAAGGTWKLIFPLAILAAIVALGSWIFTRMAPVIAEEL
ncbi:MAG TPA: ABC transporter permease [Baekduia sp.]|nr:ABC transporter permease [Baekduia sp.]